MKKNAFLFVLTAFIIWRIALFVILFLAIKFMPLQHDFLGGGIAEYVRNPYLWSWFNFDGEHYLSIIREGYRPLTYFFFPGFPILIKYVVGFFAHDIFSYAFYGLLISNLIFLLALVGLWKLITIDFDDQIAKIAIILLLVFPTSFYFGSFYTEAIFLATVVWSMYFARKGYWLTSGIIGGFSTLTRIVGITLFPSLIAENLSTNKAKKNKFKLNLFLTLLVPLGLVIYMYYLWKVTGDPLNFLHTVGIFGPQRSSSLVFLPQVFYRYVFKIIPSLNIHFFPSLFTTLLEFFVGLAFLVISIASFYKLRLSYSLFLLFGYLIPTFSGSFSSLPRYVVVLFPGFILVSVWLKNKPGYIKFIVYFSLVILLTISTLMFTRGFWIS